MVVSEFSETFVYISRIINRSLSQECFKMYRSNYSTIITLLTDNIS